MLPRKNFESVHAQMAILVLFEFTAAFLNEEEAEAAYFSRFRFH